MDATRHCGSDCTKISKSVMNCQEDSFNPRSQEDSFNPRNINGLKKQRNGVGGNLSQFSGVILHVAI